MHAVGDVPDGDVEFVPARPQGPPHPPRGPSVQGGDAVGHPGRLQAEDGQAEGFLLIGRVEAPEGHHLLPAQAERLPQGAEGLLDEVAVEPVVAGLDRRVGGEDGLGLDAAEGFREIDLVGDHLRPGHLQEGEGAVPLVEMDHARPDAEQGQGAYAPHAEDELLPDADARVRLVKPPREFAVLFGVFLHVGVEEQQGRPADPGLPQADPDLPRGGLQPYADRLPFGILHTVEGQEIDRGLGKALLLPPVCVEALVEVSLGVEEPHPDDRQAQVGGALEVVSRQHAQPSRVYREGLVKPELGRKIGHRARLQGARKGVSPGLLRVQVLVEPVKTEADPRLQGQVDRSLDERFRRELGKERHGVVVHSPPEGGIQVPEEGDRVRLPGPPEVPGQLAQFRGDVHGDSPFSVK